MNANLEQRRDEENTEDGIASSDDVLYRPRLCNAGSWSSLKVAANADFVGVSWRAQWMQECHNDNPIKRLQMHNNAMV